MNKAEEIIDSILIKRGFLSEEERKEFLTDKPKKTYDPYLLPDIEEGTDFLYSALAEGRHICIYGDYDVDGIMSTVLICSFLRNLNSLGLTESEIDWYIPSRFDEGYGLNCGALDTIKETGAELVITVDCGSVSKTEIEYAETIELDVIVTDHHQCSPHLLPDCPVINPMREDSEYPFPYLSGCGVAFKTMQAFRQKFYPDNENIRNFLNDTLDIVALATVADVVPLIDENRTLVKYGIKSINSRKRVALAKLNEMIQVDTSNVNTVDIGFRIGPHINAAGRLDDAGSVIELFLSEDQSRMEEIIKQLISLNTERKRVQDKAEKECINLVESEYADDNFLLLRPDEIHEGVSGIVAGRIKNRFNRPTAVIALSEDKFLKGSARSTQGIDIIALFRRHDSLFLKLGGHAMAAGFTLSENNENLLRKELNEDIASLLTEDPSLFDEDLSFDVETLPEDLTMELAEMMQLFEPTGTQNHAPRLLIKGPLITNTKSIGSEKAHLSFSAGGIRCIIFNPDDESSSVIKEGQNVELYATLGVNKWNGYQNVQLAVQKARSCCV